MDLRHQDQAAGLVHGRLQAHSRVEVQLVPERLGTVS